MLDRIKDNISVISVSVILLGYYYIYDYYNRFGINIYNYLEPTEIIFAFSSLFIVVVKFLILGLIFKLILSVSFGSKETNPMHGKKDLMGFYRSFILFGLSLLGISVFVFIPSFSLFINEGVLIFSVIVIMYLISNTIQYIELRRKYDPEYKVNPDLILPSELMLPKPNYVVLFILFIGLINYQNFIRCKHIKQGTPTHSVEIKTSNGFVSSTNSFLYIGSTRSYVFFYDTLNKDVKAYPERQIEKIKIRQLREGL